MKKVLWILIAALVLSMSGLAQKSKLKVGKKAPDFEVGTLDEKKVSLESLLETNDFVVVHFFIGSWFKYDPTYLTKLNEIYPNLKDKKTEVVAITRGKPIFLKPMMEEKNIGYKIGLDSDWYVMSTYGVAVKITPNYVPLKHKEYSASNAKHTGSKDGMIPIPATYLINKEGRIVWMHFDPDYRQRPDVNEILNNIK